MSPRIKQYRAPRSLDGRIREVEGFIRDIERERREGVSGLSPEMRAGRLAQMREELRDLKERLAALREERAHYLGGRR